MAIALVAAQIRHERRVRLAFSNDLAPGAFTLAAYYSVVALDDGVTAPVVVKALIVASSPSVVELQLGADLVQGARYRFAAVGVPAVDATTTPDPSTADAAVGREQAPAATAAPGPVTELERVVHGVDVLCNGGDFLEDQSGDLAQVSGIRCSTEDAWRFLLANGLPWDPTYGLRAREEVDGALAGLLALRGRAIAGLRQDDRVSEVDATVDASDPTSPVLEAQIRFVGARGAPVDPLRLPLSSSR